MTILGKHLEKANLQDKYFIGTIALKNEEIALPDGSKMALGIDDGHWVLIYQKAASTSLRVYKYDRNEDKIEVDQKPGREKDLKDFKKLLNYFFSHASVEDLVTLLPPQG